MPATLSSVWQFMMPYLATIMIPLVAVIIAFLKIVLDRLEHLRIKLAAADENAKATDEKIDIVKKNTDGMLSRLQDTIDRKDVEKEATALQVENDKKLAVAKASEREKPNG